MYLGSEKIHVTQINSDIKNEGYKMKFLQAAHMCFRFI